MKRLSLFITGILMLIGAFMMRAPVFAIDAATQDSVCVGIGLADDTTDCEADTGTSVNGIVRTVISIMSYVVGIAATIMIIVSGFKYVTSGGDSNRVSSAKSTILYALIGLVIAVLAQVMVLFVFKQAASPPSASVPSDGGADCRATGEC